MFWYCQVSAHRHFCSPLLDGIRNGLYAQDDFPGKALVSITWRRGRDHQPQTSWASSPDHLHGVISASQQQRKKQSILLTDWIIFISCSPLPLHSPSAEEATENQNLHQNYGGSMRPAEVLLLCSGTSLVPALPSPACSDIKVPSPTLALLSVLGETSWPFPQPFSTCDMN